MPIVTTKEMFRKAYEGGYAVGAFNVNNMEIVQGITEAAAEVKAPVILQVSRGARAYANHTYLVKLVEAAEQETGLPIALHLDHGDSFELCKSCIDGGFTSVMIDGSSKSFEDNIALTRQVVEYAHAHGVRIIGDLPMYVAPDSADVWAQPAQFRLDPDGQPSAVAGVPPDYFSADGQLWGNPLYDWDAMRADGFRWWKDRTRGAAKRYDVVRLDHFRAISSYWVVPRGELTARGGHWAPGPGPALLQALHTAAPELELIAEDLGTIDDDVRRLVARSGCPGMRVLLFGFDPSGTSEHRPDRVRAHSVCYVGTHDNAPAAAWAALGGADADYAMRCLGVYDVARLPETLLRAGMGSRAELFIAQMQDVLGLGAESRMNTPGTAAGNWVWRLLPGQADARTAARLLARTQAACRA
mgnify:CR=1 FL=1